ncbi:MAG: formimidoylglutamase [Halioglobus sp.]
MYIPADPKLWSGRVDEEDGVAGYRWHQVVSHDSAAAAGVALLGFASDRGVQLNKGRVGACEGPTALRRALANQAWHHDVGLYDAGDVRVGSDLAAGQQEYARRVAELLASERFVVGLGGGHEIAWASYLGCRHWLDAHAPGKTLGILNFDAHFDLRQPAPDASSGTPFFQVAEHCQAQGHEFHYACLGVARTSNTKALFSRANSLGVDYLLDVACKAGGAGPFVQRFIDKVDYLYVTTCMDVFPAAIAPGVSAPAALGIDPDWVLATLTEISSYCSDAGVQWLMADIAELAPVLDRDGMTARLAARLIDEILSMHHQLRLPTSQVTSL